MSTSLDEKTGSVDLSPVGKICGFCGTVGVETTRFAGGLGVFMCLDCLEIYHQSMFDPAFTVNIARPPWETMSDTEMLQTLPLIDSIEKQTHQFLNDWVTRLRARNLSWAAIGKAIGISRQAAWERFTRTSPPPS